MTDRVSRLAPSPTGALHLGNIRTFLVNWALARQRGWALRMRIEDLDGPRVKPESAGAMLDLLAWLGLDHDGPVMCQSGDLEPYRRAMRALADRGLAYACPLSRREVEQALSAPHAGESRPAWLPSLRPTDPLCYRFDGDETNYRLVVGPGAVDIHDEFAGPSRHHPDRDSGDVVIWTRRGVPAYQLAVVVDDARQAVSDVVRGDDLLPSAALQVLLYRALGLTAPRWWHLPLVLGEDGRRLAKRHGDTRVERYRAHGVSPERIVGLMAWWCGVSDRREAMGAGEFRAGFRIEGLGREPVVFGAEDEAWILRKC